MHAPRHIQYIGTPGVRINSQHGSDLDLDFMHHTMMFAKLWLGHPGETHAEKVLTPEEVEALRDACTRWLVEYGPESAGNRAIEALQEAKL